MYFEEMLGSHIEDVDKYINTFCFYIQQLLERANTGNLIAFVKRILEEFELQGRRILMPTKIVTIFIAMVEGLLNRCRLSDKVHSCSRDQLEMLIGKIIAALKEEGYLATFVDNTLDYDKKRRTSIYKEISSLRSRIHTPATEDTV
jgi:hypothetical protein